MIDIVASALTFEHWASTQQEQGHRLCRSQSTSSNHSDSGSDTRIYRQNMPHLERPIVPHMRLIESLPNLSLYDAWQWKINQLNNRFACLTDSYWKKNNTTTKANTTGVWFDQINSDLTTNDEFRRTDLNCIYKNTVLISPHQTSTLMESLWSLKWEELAKIGMEQAAWTKADQVYEKDGQKEGWKDFQ